MLGRELNCDNRYLKAIECDNEFAVFGLGQRLTNGGIDIMAAYVRGAEIVHCMFFDYQFTAVARLKYR